MNFQTVEEQSYLKKLNSRQKEGVLTTDGPVLVIAGAGSGKTSMLTARMAHLISAKGVSPNQILAVTFTNKAAGEMRERVARLLGTSELSWRQSYLWADMHAPQFMQQPLVGTFHSVCIRILRQEMMHLPFKGPFQVYDDSDQLSLVKECFTKLNINDKTFSPKNIQYAINQAKCQALEPHEIPVKEYDLFGKTLIKVYELYQTELFRNNGIDFGEIITLTYRLFRDKPEVLERYQNLFQYIHVDEYQDTNRAQYLVVHQLAAKHRNLCVVGDEDQSIYRWRGADIRNILDFEKDYPESVTIKLEQNYRSTKIIIGASSALISNNSMRKEKTLWTENPEGFKIQRLQLNDEHQEANFAVKTMKALCSEKYAFGDVAVFYRTNAQSRIFEDYLRRERIPYNVVGALKFYDRKEIKDALAYLRIIVNEADSIGLKRVINVPQRGIGKSTIEKVETVQFQEGKTFIDAIEESTKRSELSSGTKKKLADFLSLLRELKNLSKSMSLLDFYHEVLDRTGYLKELRTEGTEESQSRIENLQELSNTIQEFQTRAEAPPGYFAAELLGPFLESVSLATEVQDEDSGAGKVSLMTLHTSKGLEFPVVYMVGCEDGLFPSIRPGQEDAEEELEEERRLCYVGMTRAREVLYMSHTNCRRIYGNITFQNPSRFFKEIPARFMEFKNLSDDGNQEDTREDSGISRSPTYVSEEQSFIGKRVLHFQYGQGFVKDVQGSGPEAKVTVSFKGLGEKKFIMKFAKLEIIG